MDSILDSIKVLLNIEPECRDFDTELIMHINSALFALAQIGVGPENGHRIRNETDTWDDFIEDCPELEVIRTYIYKKVRMVFDTPSNSYVVDAIKNSMDEDEFRIRMLVENGTFTYVNHKLEELDNRVSALETKTSEHDKLFKALVGENNE